MSRESKDAVALFSPIENMCHVFPSLCLCRFLGSCETSEAAIITRSFKQLFPRAVSLLWLIRIEVGLKAPYSGSGQCCAGCNMQELIK